MLLVALPFWLLVDTWSALLVAEPPPQPYQGPQGRQPPPVDADCTLDWLGAFSWTFVALTLLTDTSPELWLW